MILNNILSCSSSADVWNAAWFAAADVQYDVLASKSWKACCNTKRHCESRMTAPSSVRSVPVFSPSGPWPWCCNARHRQLSAWCLVPRQANEQAASELLLYSYVMHTNNHLACGRNNVPRRVASVLYKRRQSVCAADTIKIYSSSTGYVLVVGAIFKPTAPMHWPSRR